MPCMQPDTHTHTHTYRDTLSLLFQLRMCREVKTSVWGGGQKEINKTICQSRVQYPAEEIMCSEAEVLQVAPNAARITPAPSLRCQSTFLMLRCTVTLLIEPPTSPGYRPSLFRVPSSACVRSLYLQSNHHLLQLFGRPELTPLRR